MRLVIKAGANHHPADRARKRAQGRRPRAHDGGKWTFPVVRRLYAVGLPPGQVGAGGGKRDQFRGYGPDAVMEVEALPDDLLDRVDGECTLGYLREFLKKPKRELAVVTQGGLR